DGNSSRVVCACFGYLPKRIGSRQFGYISITMLVARIRGTREQLRKLDAAGLRLHRTGVRSVSGSVFEVHGVLEEPEASLLELWGYNVIIIGDVKELLSKRLKPA